MAAIIVVHTSPVDPGSEAALLEYFNGIHKKEVGELFPELESFKAYKDVTADGSSRITTVSTIPGLNGPEAAARLASADFTQTPAMAVTGELAPQVHIGELR